MMFEQQHALLYHKLLVKGHWVSKLVVVMQHKGILFDKRKHKGTLCPRNKNIILWNPPKVNSPCSPYCFQFKHYKKIS